MKEPRFYRNICYEVMVLFAFMQRALPVNPTVLLLCCPRVSEGGAEGRRSGYVIFSVVSGDFPGFFFHFDRASS